MNKCETDQISRMSDQGSYKLSSWRKNAIVTESAPWHQVLLYVVTFGRMGRTHQARRVMMDVWDTRINCRCVVPKLEAEE